MADIIKKIFLVALLLFHFNTKAQGTENQEIKQVVIDFFEGFHAKDSLRIKGYVSENILMHTVVKSENSGFEQRSQDFGKFLQAITSIPDSVSFLEEIKDYRILVNGPLAVVWTPYEFRVNGEFSHCGVNVFHLIRKKESWKITSIIDTRRKEKCP